MEVVAALVKIQQKARQSDAEFAAALGIPRSTWQHYKAGGAVSLPFIRRVVDRFPQVRPQVERLIFGADANKGSVRRQRREQTA